MCWVGVLVCDAIASAYGNVRSVRICLKYLWRVRYSLVCFALTFMPGVIWMVLCRQIESGLDAQDYYLERDGIYDCILSVHSCVSVFVC